MEREERLRFLYTAWFRNEQAISGDQDVEWPACFVVVSSDPNAAQEWGDHLALSFAARWQNERFLRSSIELANNDSEASPVIHEGDELPDSVIGW
jgi:hypothetical protein